MEAGGPEQPFLVILEVNPGIFNAPGFKLHSFLAVKDIQDVIARPLSQVVNDKETGKVGSYAF